MNAMRLSFRSLRRRPVFTVFAVGLLGTTLGLAVTAGSVAYVTLWRAMPYADEDRLVALYWSRDDLGIPDMSLSLVETLELTARTSAFEAVAATQTPINVTLSTQEGSSHLAAGLVTPDAFQVLGIRPLPGRGFRPDEGERGTPTDAVVLSHAAWMRLFGGRPDVPGASIVLNQRARTVVGVLPPRLSLAPERAEPVDVWFPMGVAEEFLGAGVFSTPAAASFRANARLREGLAAEDLRAEMERVGAAVGRDYPATHEGWQFRAEPLRARVVGSAAGPVAALFLGGALFCGVALVNLASLLRQRSDEGARAVTIRRALGATGNDIQRLRAAEAIALAGLAAAVAAAVTHVGLSVATGSDLLQLPAHVSLGWSWMHVLTIVASSLAGTLGVGTLTGVAADARLGALRVAGVDTVHGWRRHTPTLALALQVTLSMSLTVGALAALRSLGDLRGMDVGIDADGLLSARVDVPRDLRSIAEVAQDARDLTQRARELAGVSGAAIWSPEVPTDAHTFTRARLESAPGGGDRDPVVARYHTVSPGAIGALGIRIIAGRDMHEDDRTGGRRVALVSASAAELWWGGAEAALGQRIQRLAHTEWSDVVGVVADVPLSGRFGPGSDNTLDVFFMFDQDPRTTFLVLVKSERESVDIEGLRMAAGSVMPGVPLHDFRWMADRLREQERGHRSTATLGGLYAAASLLLASVGLVGSTLLLLGRRRGEVGLRQVLGASRPRVVLELLRGSMFAVSVGIVAGVFFARAGLGLVDPVILRVGPADPVSHFGAAAILGGCALIAMVAASLSTVRRNPAQNLMDMPGRL